MCGIVGVLGKPNGDITPRLVEGLRRLEYRGYDSAGIATLTNGRIERRRAEGKLANLDQRIIEDPIYGDIGIAHTRWATHGVPNEVNAHPHATTRVAAVHNGIIENFQALRSELVGLGHNFESETDSEAIVHLITHYLDQGKTPREAMAAALGRLDGAFALAVIFAGHHDQMFGARRGSPLVVGWGDGEMFLGSDAYALANMTNRISFLEEGDWIDITRDGAEIFDKDNQPVDRKITKSELTGDTVGKGGHAHFMLKEIYEQPTVIGDTLNTYFNPADRTVSLPAVGFDMATVSKITIVACGTAYLAGMVAKYWLEKYAGVSVELDIASEFRYRGGTMPKDGLALAISQSGETADTLAALRYGKSQGQHTLAIVNMQESTMARESDSLLPIHAGPEIGVAATKTFACQLVVLACLTIAMGRARGILTAEDEARLSTAISEVPARAADVLAHDDALRLLASEIADAQDVLYIGRGTSYPIALEGALKLKEISYIHAEGFAAGELKHGPISLIEEGVPVIVLAPSDELFEKTTSNMHEVIARGARVVYMSDKKGIDAAGDELFARIQLPEVDPFVTPILYAIPVQLLAYHVAVVKGTDVDQPRNLAKSVTVE